MRLALPPASTKATTLSGIMRDILPRQAAQADSS
jgi:hypothetical protein